MRKYNYYYNYCKLSRVQSLAEKQIMITEAKSIRPTRRYDNIGFSQTPESKKYKTRESNLLN